MTRATAALLASVALCAGCKPSARPSPTADAAPASSAGPVVTSDRAATLRRIAMAEHKRASSEIKPEDLSSRDVEVRRHAARALARITDGAALEGLKRLLSDEDPEVVAWSAYGLGYGCKGSEATTVRALVSRAATLAATPSGAKVGLDVGAALADALGRCGGPEAEATLRAWLDIDDKGEAAALALGRMASRKKRIDDASIVALLDAASRPEKPGAAALLAFTRIDAGSDAIRMRLYEVASEALAGPAGPRRSYAVRALGRSGDQAVPSLVKVLEGEAFTVSERSDAARELARVGKAGQVALQKSLPSLLPKPDALATLTGAAFSPLVVALESLVLPARDAKAALEQIATLEPPKDQPALARRVITLRCRAASILAGSAIAHPKLVSCDPDPEGATGRLALLEVLARDKLTGTRLVRFKELCESKSAVVRQAALDKLGAHPEATGTEQLLAKALRAPDAGTVATAAQVIASYPDRAAERRVAAPDPADSGATPEPIKPHPMVVDALTTAFTLQRPPDSIEVFAALADAAGALQVLSFKPRLDAFCKSANPTLREHAEKALRVMGEQKRVCKAEGPAPSPPELEQPLTEKTTLVFETDAGEVKLTLDPTLAPVATTRLVALTRAGFFEKNRIHRVVPGFVVQLGDPGGDGYGGAGKDPLACETSPVSFDPLSVGVALAGRDTGSSQFFVTLAAFPHLDGDYALIGRAEPGWERLAQGDVVQRVRVVAP